MSKSVNSNEKYCENTAQFFLEHGIIGVASLSRDGLTNGDLKVPVANPRAATVSYQHHYWQTAKRTWTSAAGRPT